jgi:hypothetical protein
MKKIYSVIILCVFCGLTAQAQLRVLSNGRVQAGLLKDNNEDAGNVTSMQIFGRTGDMRAGSKLTFGDFGLYSNQGWNVFVGEYGTGDSDQLWLHGKLGIYLTTNGYANNVVAYYNPSSNSNFVFNTDIRVNGVSITSDAKLKENVKQVKNPLDILSKINGVTYNYKLSELNKVKKEGNAIFDPSKDTKNKEISEKIAQREIENANKTRIGFVAQEIKEVLPELVEESENELLSVDYIGLIPVLVEGIKELQSKINVLEELLAEQETYKLKAAISNEEILNTNGSILYQNSPNPFNIETTIKYQLPTNCTNAKIILYSLSGAQVKEIGIHPSSTSVNITAGELQPGIYLYTLFVNNQKVDTKKLIISK